MIRAHWSAVMSLLSGVKAYETRAPAGTAPPYVVIHPDQGTATTTRFDTASDWRNWSFQTDCVGTTVEQAQWMAEKVEAALLDKKPAVTGRVCGPIRSIVARPMDRDEDVQPPLFLARTLWAFPSLPN
jgi:hypothetical protein